jgi:hypothetical protein
MARIRTIKPELPQFEVMPVDVFVGGGGHVVLCQEWTSIENGESYSRILIKPADAEAVCKRLMRAVGKPPLAPFGPSQRGGG